MWEDCLSISRVLESSCFVNYFSLLIVGYVLIVSVLYLKTQKRIKWVRYQVIDELLLFLHFKSKPGNKS